MKTRKLKTKKLKTKKLSTKKLSTRIIKENMNFSLMTLPMIIYLALFAYWPMFGVVLAFKNYKVTKGIFGSEWMDPLFKNFEFILKSQDAVRIVRNTLLMNATFIIVCNLCAVVFALIMFEVKKNYQVKAYQTFAILPSFLSWVAVSYIVYGFLEPSNGLLNRLILSLGGNPVSWYQKAEWWPLILTVVKVWHGTGYAALMFYASLMGVDSELFEAAEIDGANKLQRIRFISVPHLVSIVTIMVILDVGKIFNADFGLFYNVPRNVGALYATTDVIDTYVYRALIDQGNIGMSSAASFIQSVVCMVMLLAVNAIVRKVSPENALF